MSYHKACGKLCLNSEHGIGRAAHAYIGDICRFAGKEFFVGGGHMGMSAENNRNTPVKVFAQGDFFTGGFAVNVNHNVFAVSFL